MRSQFLVLAVAHGVLVISFMYIFDYHLSVDSKRYLAVADELMQYSLQFSGYNNCNTAPGYPLFLASVRSLTWDNMYLIALCQSVLFVVSLRYFLVGLTTVYSISNKNQIFLSLFILLNPEIIHLNGAVLSESLAASTLLLVCSGMINRRESIADKVIFVASVCLLIITRMEYTLVLFAIFPFLLRFRKWKVAFGVFGVLFVVLLINGVKNYQTFGVYKISSFGAGTVIYGGNNLNLDGSWHVPGETKHYIPDQYEKAYDSISELPMPCACIAGDQLFKEMATAAWLNAPMDQLKVIPVKFGKLWLLPGVMDFYTNQVEIQQGLQLAELFNEQRWPRHGRWKHGVYLIVYWLSLIISIAGFFFKLKRYTFDRVDVLFLSILLIATLMYSIPFYGLGRFHLPVLAIVFYYAVFVFERFTNRKSSSVS